MHILAISSTVSQGLKARIETLLPIAALVLIGLLPRTGQAMPIELGGSGLKVNVATNESPAPYKLSSFIERKACAPMAMRERCGCHRPPARSGAGNRCRSGWLA